MSKNYLDKSGLSYFWSKLKTILNGKADTSDLTTKQDTLVSGTNIKTINGASVVGSGDLTVEGTPEVAISTTQPSEDEKVWINPSETTNQAKYFYNNEWQELSIKALDSMPIGSIILFAGETIPTGWLICDGDTLNEEEYPELYNVIGHTYGGSNLDFNLPNFKGRVPVGLDANDTDFDTLGETGGYKGLQKHTHQSVELGGNTMTSWSSTGSGGIFDLSSLFKSNQFNNNQVNTGNVNGNATDNGAPSTATNGNLQPYLVVNYIIKATNTTPTMASVVNAQSNSTVDTYSCDYENKHYGGVVLYNNSTGDNGNITLSESVANYSFIEIYYAKGDGSYSSNKVNTPDGKNMTLYCANNYANNSLQELWKYITISGTSITSNYGVARNSSTTGIGNLTIENQVKIFKVIGYK